LYSLTSMVDHTYERLTHRGKHKIFIGMAPGVGKTYRMLDEAHRLKKSGVDVVIGFLETHDRQETADKSIGLEVIQAKIVRRGDLVLREFDQKAVIDRQPKLVLIDELAQSNSPNLGHNLGQKIEAILAAGIDVYSTVNIQHIHHLSDRVAQITGMTSDGGLPDSLLDNADELIVVDVTPETLEKRLLTGKIYPPDQIEEALQGFFQRRNLVALRELALREVADQIEEEGIRATIRRCGDNCNPSTDYCQIHERVLVCVSTAPNSLRLVQRGAKLADYMNAPLYVLFVHKPERSPTKSEARFLECCERICQKFDAKFLQVTGESPVEEIIKAAKSHRITQVVLGQSHQSRWQVLWRGSLINQLVRSVRQIDVHIISTSQ
jgi:two-component system, OmpR family, sensor histidine kinase KdpD